MIPLLRLLAFAGNVVLFGGLALLLGASMWVAALTCAFVFALSWFGCAITPKSRPAGEELQAAAAATAARMGAPPPLAVVVVPGWAAAAFRIRNGYGLLLGEEVEPSHREAVLAHEIAHALTGDLLWEPFTDGPARLLHDSVRALPPFSVALMPFLVTAVPLARATELRADRLAAAVVPAYSAVLEQVLRRTGTHPSLLYPSSAQRIRRSARDSWKER